MCLIVSLLLHERRSIVKILAHSVVKIISIAIDIHFFCYLAGLKCHLLQAFILPTLAPLVVNTSQRRDLASLIIEYACTIRVNSLVVNTTPN